MGLAFDEKKLISEIKEQKLPEQMSQSLIKDLSQVEIVGIKFFNVVGITLGSIAIYFLSKSIKEIRKK